MAGNSAWFDHSTQVVHLPDIPCGNRSSTTYAWLGGDFAYYVALLKGNHTMICPDCRVIHSLRGGEG